MRAKIVDIQPVKLLAGLKTTVIAPAASEAEPPTAATEPPARLPVLKMTDIKAPATLATVPTTAILCGATRLPAGAVIKRSVGNPCFIFFDQITVGGWVARKKIWGVVGSR